MDKLELSNQPISLVSELCRQYVLGILKALDKGVKPEDTHLGNILVRLYPPKISLVDFGLWGKEESFRKATAKFPMTGLNSNFFPLDFLTDLFPLHGLRTELLSVARKNPLLKVQGIMVQRSDYKDFFEKQLAPLFVPSLVNPSFCLKLVHPQLPLAFPPAVLHAIQKAPQIKGIAKSCIHLQICLEGLLSFLCSEGGSESELTKQCEELQQKEKELTQKLYEERFDTPQALDQVDFQKLLPERAHSSTNKHLQLLILRYLWVIWQAGMFGRIVARRVDLDPKREAVRLFAETQQIGDWTASKILRLPNTKEGVEDSKGPWLSSLSSDYLSSKL